LIIAIIDHERGIPSKRESSARIDYVPALCTHRPSHLPMNGSVKLLDRGSEALLARVGCRGKLVKPHHLEEGEVVTRFP
jgi:hypothetical protein